MGEGSGSINDGVIEGKILGSFYLFKKNISLVFNAWHGQEIFLTSIQTCSGAHPPTYSVHFQRFFSLQIQGPGQEIDHLPPFNAKVGMNGTVPPPTHIP